MCWSWDPVITMHQLLCLVKAESKCLIYFWRMSLLEMSSLYFYLSLADINLQYGPWSVSSLEMSCLRAKYTSSCLFCAHIFLLAFFTFINSLQTHGAICHSFIVELVLMILKLTLVTGYFGLNIMLGKYLNVYFGISITDSTNTHDRFPGISWQQYGDLVQIQYLPVLVSSCDKEY